MSQGSENIVGLFAVAAGLVVLGVSRIMGRVGEMDAALERESDRRWRLSDRLDEISERES